MREIDNKSDNREPQNQGEIVVYRSDDGRVRLDVRLQDETVWLTQQLMAELFQTSQQNISHHIQSVYEEGELTPEATHKKYLWVRREGGRQVRRNLDCYNLDHGKTNHEPRQDLHQQRRHGVRVDTGREVFDGLRCRCERIRKNQAIMKIVNASKCWPSRDIMK